jgi:hypothetical protein
MKTMMMLAAIGLLSAAGGCRTSAPPAAYANPVDACAGEATQAERDACMKNVVADVAMSVKRESQRKPPR